MSVTEYLTLCLVQMDSSLWFYTIHLGWSIVYIEGSQAIISKNIVFISLKIDIVLGNSVDSYEMLHYAAFSQGLHCLPKYPFSNFPYAKG